MYRRSQIMKEKENQEEQFLAAMGTLPVVQSAVSQLLGMYSRTKEHNRLVRFTLETAESGVLFAANTAKPIVNVLPVERLNSAACYQLDQLKTSYPIITKPTDQVLAETHNLYAATLKPTVDRVVAVKKTGVDTVQSVQQYGVDKVNGVKTFTVDTVSGAKQYSLSTLASVKDRGVKTAQALLQTPYGRVVAAKVDGAVAVTDAYVEKYLPPTEEEGQNGGMEVDIVEGEPTTLTRVQGLTDKVRKRMMARSLKELKNVQVRSQEMLSKLSFTVDLIEYARTNLDSVKSQVSQGMSAVGERASNAWEGTSNALQQRMAAAQTKLGQVWTEINKTEEEIDEEGQSDASKFERRILSTARHLTHSLHNMYNSLSSTIKVLPSSLQDKIHQAGELSTALANIFSTTKFSVKDIPQISLDNVRLQLQHMQELVSSLSDVALEKAATLSHWIVPSRLQPTFFRGQAIEENPETEENLEAEEKIEQ